MFDRVRGMQFNFLELRLYWAAIIVCFLIAGISRASDGHLPSATPESVGLDVQRLHKIQPLVEEGIREGKMPGCVICVGRHGKIAYLEAFGNKLLDDPPVAMTIDTVFDMASITKPVATATSVMKLVEQGKIRLAAPVVEFFPEFAPNGKDKITVQDLLIHQSGLIPDNALSDYLDGPELAWERICQLDLVAPVGTTFKYSDVNFIVLAEIVRKVTGQDIHSFSQEQIFEPLKMEETGYLPSEPLRERAAATEKRDGQWMQGTVHDPRCYALNGIAGHAGLFSTANDLAKYAHMMLGKGTLHVDGQVDTTVLSPQTVAAMTQGYRVSSGLRGLGWDKRTGYSSNRGDLLSDSAFGHGGFTGTVLWIDPELDLFFIFLSNRVHPNGSGSVNHLAGRIANVIASSVTIEPRQQEQTATTRVLTGIDVLQLHQFRELAGRRVGLITNHTGRDRHGEGTAQLLSKSTNLVALFSPEHGFEGKLDVAHIGDSADAATGLKIHSLYGETRRPTAEMLKDIDVLVFDIQDIGARFYTYISTMGEAMQAAAEHGKQFVVLDRPNPINGKDVAGPMLDAGAESFVAFHQLPVRHGMTIGEIALLLKDERGLDLDLKVIECQGWRREMSWEATNLTWINPSPNMRSLTQAFLYPGIGLLETTNVSVGRGTDTPFEVLGAPWIDGKQLAAALSERRIAGVRFVPIEFTPASSKFADQLCQGINVAIVDQKLFEPVSVGLEIACQLRALFPNDWDTKSLNRLLGSQAVFQAIVDGAGVAVALDNSLDGVSDFKRKRSKYLLYE
ncbi:MAG: DUF1343 domain-containing protein [Planctomycetales bacterium]|nr:DUF1343 domain-containing protein [Planctomycetales bacterium]